MKFLHWDQVDPYAYKPRIQDFERQHRFQTIAVVGDFIMGHWRFDVRKTRSGRTWIDSWRTDVHTSYRNTGVARELWRIGIERWNACRVDTTIATWRGCRFVSSIVVWGAQTMPDVFFKVSAGDRFDSFNQQVAEKAIKALEKNAKASSKVRRLAIVP